MTSTPQHHHRRLGATRAAVAALALIGASCSGASDSTVASDESTTTTAGANVSTSAEPIIGSGPIDQGLWPFIDIAVADLAERLGLSPGEITVNRAVLTTWSNGSLGCPDPKMVYTQVAMDGAVMELGAAGATWWYHSGGTQVPFLCESPLRTHVD